MADWYLNLDNASGGRNGSAASPWNSAAEVNAGAADGDTIFIRPVSNCGTLARRLNFTKSFTLRGWDSNYVEGHGRRAIDTAAATQVSFNAFGVCYSVTLASGLDAAGTGLGVMALAKDYGLRRHRYGQFASLMHRRALSVVTGVTFAAAPSRTSNVVSATTSATHNLRAGDWIQVQTGDAGFDGQFKVATASGTSLTWAQTGSNATASAAGRVDIARSCFHYDNATGVLTFREIGATSGNTPTGYEYVFGGGADGDYACLQITGAGKTLTVINPRLATPSFRINNGGNCLLASGGAKIVVRCDQPDCWIMDGGDHCFYSGSGGANGGLDIQGGPNLYIGGCGAHEGDSIGVGYTTSGNVANQDMVGFDLGHGLPISYDGLLTGEALPADQGQTYTNSLYGITSHVGTVASQFVTDVEVRAVRVWTNRYSFNTATAVEGFVTPGEALLQRDCAPRAILSDSIEPLPGRHYDCVVYDAPTWRHNIERSANGYQRCLFVLTGWYDAGSAAFFNNNDGVMGEAAACTDVHALMVDCTVITSATQTSGVLYRASRSASSTNNRRRWVRPLWLVTSDCAANSMRVVDTGTVSAISMTDLAAGSGTSYTYARVLEHIAVQDNRSEFVDGVIAFKGIAGDNANLYGVGQLFGVGYGIRELMRMIPFRGMKMVGFSTTPFRLAAAGELAAIGTLANWSAFTDALVWNPGGSTTDPGIPEICWAPSAVVASTAGTSVTLTLAGHTLRVGQMVHLLGVLPANVYSGMARVTTVAGNDVTFSLGRQGTIGHNPMAGPSATLAAKPRVTLCEVSRVPGWFGTSAPASPRARNTSWWRRREI